MLDGEGTSIPGIGRFCSDVEFQLYHFSFNFNVVFTTEVEAKLNAVERVVEYAQLPAEAARTVQGKEVPLTWPQRGDIAFRKVFLKYRKDLYVNLWCSVNI